MKVLKPSKPSTETFEALKYRGGFSQTGLSKFPKTTLQYEGDDAVDAILFFLEIRKCGQYCFSQRHGKLVLRAAKILYCKLLENGSFTSAELSKFPKTTLQ